jgi:hypothetical protein
VVAAVVFFYFVHAGNMEGKPGIKKGASRISKTEKIKGPAYQNYYERKGRRVANRVIIHLNGPFAASRGLIPWLNGITGIPATNLRGWKKM